MGDTELHVLRLELAQTGDFTELVTGPSDTVLRSIAAALEAPGRGEVDVAILLLQPQAADIDSYAFHEAAFQSLRGIVGSLTLEYPGALRINLVRAASAGDAEATLAYLASPAAAFTAGATLDLTGDFE